MIDDKMNKKIVYAILALLTLYYVLQGWTDKKYLFVAAAVLGAVFVYKKVICRQEPAVVNMVTQRKAKESEMDTYIGTGVLLWIIYNYMPDGAQVKTFFQFWASRKPAFIWILLLFAAYMVLDKFAGNIWLNIHLKAISGILLIHFILNRNGNFPSYLIYGNMIIVGVTYLTALKRTLTRDETEKGNHYFSLYAASCVMLAAYLVLFLYSIGDVERILAESFFQVITPSWFLLAALAAVAGLKFISREANWMQRCTGGSIFLFLIFYILQEKGLLQYSFLGFLLSVLLADFMAEWLYKYGYLKGKFGIPVFYVLYLPVMVIICESRGKGRTGMSVVLLIAAFLIIAAKNWNSKLKKKEFWFVLGSIPYFLLITAKSNLENENYIIVFVMTALLLGIFLNVEKWNDSRQKPKANADVWNGKNLFFCICIMLPLLLTARIEMADDIFMDIRLDNELGPLSIGNGVTGSVKGNDKVEKVIFEWGNGKKDSFYPKIGIKTIVRDNRLTIRAKEADGKEYVFKKYFLLWDISNELPGYSLSKPSLKVKKEEAEGRTTLQMACQDEKDNVKEVILLIDGKKTEKIPMPEGTENEQSWECTYSLEGKHKVVAVCRNRMGNFSEPVTVNIG